MIKTLPLNFLAIISVLGFLFLALALGRKIFKIFRLKLDFLTESLFSVALGLGIFSYLVYFLGLVSLLYPVSFYLILFLTILVSQKEIFEVFKIFKASGEYQDFELEFTTEGGRGFEFRVFLVKGKLWIDTIKVKSIDKNWKSFIIKLPVILIKG